MNSNTFQIAIQQIKIALLLLLIMTILTGLIYPIIVTGVAQLLFPWQANGSIIKKDNVLVGSMLIGQSFNEPKYFWGRPSTTSPFPYNAASSSGSNMGPTNLVFLTTVKERVSHLQTSTTTLNKVPVDLVTASGSGLDPDISLLAAFYQVPRVAKTRQLSESEVLNLISNLQKGRTFGILGEPRVNVLELNLALDNLRKKDAGQTTT